MAGECEGAEHAGPVSSPTGDVGRVAVHNTAVEDGHTRRKDMHCHLPLHSPSTPRPATTPLFLQSTNPPYSQARSTAHGQENLADRRPTTSTAAPLHFRHIIAEEDPQRVVEIRDEEEEEEDVGVSGDGVGGDDIDGDDDGDEDEVGSGGEYSPRLMPTWLHEAFTARVAEADPKRRDKNGLPPLYAELQSFWFPQKSNYFLLSKVSPQLLNNPRFVFGTPKHCVTRSRVPTAIGYSSDLEMSSGPAGVSTPHVSSGFLGIYRYRCSHCHNPKTRKKTVTFQSWD